MRKKSIYFKSTYVFLLAMLFLMSYRETSNNKSTASPSLILPQGFSATIVADSLGAVRHIAVTKTGDLFVKLGALKNGNGIVFLSDTDNDGKMAKTMAFGNYRGTGIRIKGNELYTSSNSA